MIKKLRMVHKKLSDWWYQDVGATRIASWVSHYLVVRVPVAILAAFGPKWAPYVGFVLVLFYMAREAAQSHQNGLKDPVDTFGDMTSAGLGFADALQWIP